MFLKTSYRNSLSVAFIIATFAFLILGCFGGSQTKCVGELTVDGATFQGKDQSEPQARLNTCSKYCIEGDKGYDRLYQEFIKTPESKKVIGLDKWSAQTQNEKLGRYIDQCEQDCLKQHNDGSRKINVVCQ